MARAFHHSHDVVVAEDDIQVKSTLEAHGPGELCAPDDVLEASAVKLTRTVGGGITYEFSIARKKQEAPAVDEDAPDPESSALPSADDLDAVAAERTSQDA